MHQAAHQCHCLERGSVSLRQSFLNEDNLQRVGCGGLWAQDGNTGMVSSRSWR